MIPNPRIRRELAEFLKCEEYQLAGYTPIPKLLKHHCSECKCWTRGMCDIGDGTPINVPGGAHSCGKFKPRKENQK